MNEPAFPQVYTLRDQNGFVSAVKHDGLSKRDYFACAAMQGLLSGTYQTSERGASDEALRWVAENSTAFADALIAELKKEGER